MTLLALHVGDIHTTHFNRQDDRATSLAQIALRARQLSEGDLNEVGVILVPGDLFHTITTPADRNAMVDWLLIAAAVAPVVVVRGNHDQPGELDLLSRLSARHPIIVSTIPELVTVTAPKTGRKVAVFTLPYPERGGIVAAGVAKGDVATLSAETLDVLCLHAGDELAKSGADAKVFAAHVNVAGSLASTGQPQIGKEVELSRESLRHFGPEVYIAFNHIHKHQVVGRGVYAGSICRLDFGENDPKGYVEVEFTPTEAKWAFVELDVPRQITIECDLGPGGVSNVRVDGQVVDEVDVAGADVRVLYTYAKSDSQALDRDDLTRALNLDTARSVKLVPRPIATVELRAPKVSAATTVEEKVQAWLELSGKTWTPGLSEKLAMLLREARS